MDLSNFFTGRKQEMQQKKKTPKNLALGQERARTGIHLSAPIEQGLRFRRRDRSPLPSRQYYEVQVGDSLSRIAKAHYGEAAKWKIIYEANKRTIKNPDEIFPGQVIELPDGRTPEGRTPDDRTSSSTFMKVG